MPPVRFENSALWNRDDFIRQFIGQISRYLKGKSMLKIIYVLITAIFLVLAVIDLFRETNWKKQLTHIIVIIPFLLRVLLIK